MRRPAPGEVIAVALVVEALAADVWLIRKGHDPISTCVRRSATARRVVRWFGAHLTDSIPGDLLTFAAARITSRLVAP